MSATPPPVPPAGESAGPDTPGGGAAPPKDRLRSINCTQCGAPLSLLGGQQVRSITCRYCGSELDRKDEYKVVRRFNTADRPLTAFELGMTGRLHGVEFTIIGLVQYRTTDGYGWIEFALFSPTHGYAWLEQVDGHFLFSRRVRDLPATPIKPTAKSTFKVRDRTYRVFESYSASVQYVEGELTFVAEAGDRVQVTEAIAPPYIYSVERTEAEEEYVLGEYLEPDVAYRAFGLRNEPARRHSVHPAQPFAPPASVAAMSSVARYFVPLAALLVVAVLVFGWGRTLLDARFDASIYGGGAESAPFEVADEGKLLALEMRSPVNNAWASYDIQVHRGADGANPASEVFSMAKSIAYYSGYDGGESWSEGSQTASAYFKVPAPGRYRLVIRGEGGSGSGAGPPPRVDVQVTVKEGVIVSRYFIALLVVFLLAYLAHHALRLRFESKRWADGDDDDDDD